MFDRQYVNEIFMFDRRTEDLTSRDTDDDKCSLITGTSVSLQDSTGSTITSLARANYNFEDRVLYGQSGVRRFSYKKRKTCSGNGIFSAPPGVSPHHVKSSIIRRNPSSSFRRSTFIFIPLRRFKVKIPFFDRSWISTDIHLAPETTPK